MKDTVIKYAITAAFNYKDSVKLQNRMVKMVRMVHGPCIEETQNIPQQPWLDLQTVDLQFQ